MNQRPILTAALLAIIGTSGALGWPVNATAAAGEDECTARQLASDQWIDTRLEAAYLFNPHLNNLSIDTEVKNGHVLLSGSVRSDIDRDLAEEIAKSLAGVQSVDNALQVEEHPQRKMLSEADTDFLQKVKDATTTAQVKTKLIGNSNISAGDIDVDTENSVVRLSGQVGSDSERQLAELIARNTSGVKSVSNQLEVSRSG